MPRPVEVNEWIARSEIDYLGPFVNAWAAFNAWFRHVSASQQDRAGLLYVRERQNSLRSAVLPYFDPQTIDTQEAATFKQDVAELHIALEAHRLEASHKGVMEHVSFRNVPLSQGPQLPQESLHRGIRYRLERANRLYCATVTNRSGNETARVEHADYSLQTLTAHASFQALPANGQGQLRALYQDCNPRPMTDLLHGDDAPIQCGTINFRCQPQDLFSGVVITIYRMRNMLLHGELTPHNAALRCYGPAYQLVRAMLNHCA